MWERKEKKPLKYSMGSQLMGYEDIGGLVAGRVVEIRQSSSHVSDNEYRLQLDPRTVREEIVEGSEKKIIDQWWIEEKEAVPFNEERFAKALVFYQKKREALKMVREAYIDMRKELYPEEYAEKEEVKT